VRIPIVCQSLIYTNRANRTISLGKYGSFPSNLIIHRPYHLTYELEDIRESESFHRLRVVPAAELYSDILNPHATTTSDPSTPAPEDEDGENILASGIEYSLVDPESGAVVAKTDRVELDENARQTLSHEEIEALKKDGSDAGKDLIAKLMLSHTMLDQKTEYSLAKYKLLKTKKYIRRFCVLPLDVPLLDHWLLEDKDPVKIMDMRDEMIGLLGCWANVHFGGEAPSKTDDPKDEADTDEDPLQPPGRWLIVDDTGGLLTAAMAERMGILYPPEQREPPKASLEDLRSPQQRRGSVTRLQSNTDDAAVSAPQEHDMKSAGASELKVEGERGSQASLTRSTVGTHPTGSAKKHRNDTAVPYADSNTLTLIHANSQPNLTFLRYYDFEATNPSQPLTHPLAIHLMTVSWLQLLDPTADSTYMSEPAAVAPEELRTWKPNRRSNYHRKRRRWARVKHIVDSTRNGGFSGLVVASTMDPISIMRHAVPLLAGGASIAIYSQSAEPLTALVDCYSIARRAAWSSDPPEEAVGKSSEELENWPGTEDFPLNPLLVLGAGIQTSRARKWQVLPGRTHPLMTGKGGAEGYVFTAWRVKPAEGKVEARGKGRAKRRKAD
jgi:tRNA (adenine58-N1)-methyltransferase non-catalytic subunit